MSNFESWWNASKYMQVVISSKSDEQIARDGWTAGYQAAKGEAAPTLIGSGGVGGDCTIEYRCSVGATGGGGSKPITEAKGGSGNPEPVDRIMGDKKSGNFAFTVKAAPTQDCCGNPSQCWEPCGELGKSEEHAKVAPTQEPVDLIDALKAVQMDAVGIGNGENSISDKTRAMVDAALLTTCVSYPIAWMYEHDGMIHDKFHPPMFSTERKGATEPWSETPLYRVPPDAAAQIAELTKQRDAYKSCEADMAKQLDEQCAVSNRLRVQLNELALEHDEQARELADAAAQIATLNKALSITSQGNFKLREQIAKLESDLEDVAELKRLHDECNDAMQTAIKINKEQKEQIAKLEAALTEEVHWRNRQAEVITKLEALLREGADGFGRVLVATSDDKAVRDWQKRCRAALGVPKP